MINPLHTSESYRAHVVASFRMDRASRVRDAVAEAVHAVNPARVDRRDVVAKYAPVVAAITDAILDGDRIIPATRDAFDLYFLDIPAKKVTPVAWRIVFDLEGGPSWWR